MKSLTLTLSALMLLGSASATLAATSHGGVGVGGTGPRASSPSFTAPTNMNARSGKALGQPGQSCQNTVAAGGSEPGNAANSPGSPFNEPDPATNSLGGTGGQHYAGNQPQNAKNTASVAQYDVACSNQK